MSMSGSTIMFCRSDIPGYRKEVSAGTQIHTSWPTREKRLLIKCKDMSSSRLAASDPVTWIPMFEIFKQQLHNRKPRKVRPLLFHVGQDERVIGGCIPAIDITRVVPLKHRKDGASQERCQHSQGRRYVGPKVDIRDSYGKQDDARWDCEEREQTVEIPEPWGDVHHSLPVGYDCGCGSSFQPCYDRINTSGNRS